MPWTQNQRALQYAYYRSRAMELLTQVEAPHPQPADLAAIIQVATRLTRTCPFIALNHLYQTIITQALAALTRTAGESLEA